MRAGCSRSLMTASLWRSSPVEAFSSKTPKRQAEMRKSSNGRVHHNPEWSWIF